MKKCILLRYGEIGLKSRKTRHLFERLYINSIKDALNKNYLKDFEIKNLGGRFVIYCKQTNEAIEILKNVAGIQSVSAALRIKFSSKNDLIKQVSKKAGLLVKDKTFGVKVKRIGKHNFKSTDLAKEVADSIYDFSSGVDLTNPSIRISLEVRNKECFLYTNTIKSVGGLPTGSSEKVLCLFSGGIDSPVAAFHMIKRGCKADFLFVNLVGEKLLNDVSKIYNFLITKYAFGYTPTLFVVDGKKLVTYLKKEVPDSLRQIALKIAFYKIGEVVAKKHRHISLVGGESLSQKSSQTLKSLLLIQNQISMSMLRPLLCFDKLEIVKIARTIGTFSSSEKIKEYCNLSSGPVTTAPRIKDLKKIPSMDVEIKSALKKLSIIKGVAITEDSLEPKLANMSEVISVDIRSELMQKNVPLKTDMKSPYEILFDNLDVFKKENCYLLICEFGVRSEDAAFELRKKGITAAGVTVENFIKYFKKKV